MEYAMNTKRYDQPAAIARFHSLKQWALLLTLALSVSAHAANSLPVADFIYHHGQFETLNPHQPTAQAVAIKDGKFIAVGSNRKIEAFQGDTTIVIDLQGQFVVPGLVDAHTHPMETIWLKNDWVDARYPSTGSVKEALTHIAQRAKTTAPGEWIYVACVSASENKFAEKRLPTKAELDQAAPNNPVILANGAHMAIVNTAGLKHMGITRNTQRLTHGGGVLHDADGEPNGVITDGMGDVPGGPTATEIAQFYARDIPEFWNQYGFTSLMAITPAAAVPVLQAVSIRQLESNIRYSVSVWAAPNGEGLPEQLDTFDMPAATNPDYYRFVAIKAWVDGENDCRTGYMNTPYLGHADTDPPGGRGTLVTPLSDAVRFATLAKYNQKIAMLHCSGDAAMNIGMNAYTEVNQDGTPHPIQREEHFGMFQLSHTQLQRAKAMKPHGFRISVQPIWLLELVNADDENMGEARAKTGFKFRTLIKAGLEPAASTDMTGIYLGNIDPFKAMYATVTRQSDKGLFEPEEAISVRDALKMWTLWASKAMGEERIKGSIEVGKLGDLVVLSDNLFKIPTKNLNQVYAVRTIVSGRTVFLKPPPSTP